MPKKYLWISFITLLLASCKAPTVSSVVSSAEETILAQDSFYHAEGEKIISPEKKQFYLEGTNVGSLFIQEAWMTLTDSPDLLNTINTLTSLYGKDTCFDLLDVYQENYWTEEDFQNCRNIGLNTLRLPLSYADVFDTDFSVIYSDSVTAAKIRSLNLTIREDHLKKIDDFIKEAGKHHLSIVLDLHGAFGSQNGNDHSIDSRGWDYLWNQDDLGAAFREKTLQTWKVLAERYQNETNILGYDLLNEPAGDSADNDNTSTTGKLQWDYFDTLYQAIRKIDPYHMIIMESCWNGENLPSPSLYQWKNVMYEFHHYEWSNMDDDAFQYQSYVNKINNLKSQSFSIPLYMGEFRPFGSSENYGKILSLFKKENIHWTSWTYKVTGNGSNNWGLYNIVLQDENHTGAEKAHIRSVDECDSYSEIEQKWKNQRRNLLPNQDLIEEVKKNL